ncbi:MAG: hypothetical protein ABID63_01960 [Pseudomonadota bacterium]
MRYVVFLLAALVALSPQAGWAHSFHVFALGDGDIIEGYAYFGGGGRPRNAGIEVMDANGTVLFQGSTNNDGEFLYQVDQRQDYIIRADTHDGHVAEYEVAADELSDSLPAAKADIPAIITSLITETAKPTPTVASPPAPTSGTSHSGMVMLDQDQLADLISSAVAKQVRPLREQLVSYEDKVRFSDILGGIGFIVGIFGAFVWWRSRPGQS